MSNIEVLHHGAVTGVTGSCHQYISDSANLLIDCGLFQGIESKRELSDFPFKASEVDALIVTHGHIDHVGRIPWLIAARFRGPIYCSIPTATLLPVILRNSLEIHIKGDNSLIDSTMERIEGQIVAFEYEEWFAPLSGNSQKATTKIRLQNAGHILGSAYVEIENNGHRCVFSGDIGSPGAVFVDPPCSPERADMLIIESTYGDRLHTQRLERNQLLARLINKALKDNGTILIPAFSLGRTQELLSIIEDLLFTGNLSWNTDSPLPIILDSPLAGELTSAYKSLANHLSKNIKERNKQGRLPLAFDNLITVDGHHEHIKLVNRLAKTEQPAIVIAASGMCQGGRIVNYLEKLLPLVTTEVLFVGYQANGTLGNKLQNFQPGDSVQVNDQRVIVNANIYSISGFSAHADQADLLNFIEGISVPPDEIRLVHGDDHAKGILAKLIKDSRPECSVVIPA